MLLIVKKMKFDVKSRKYSLEKSEEGNATITSAAQSIIPENLSKIQENIKEVNRLRSEMRDLTKRVNILEVQSRNGIFVWKIDSVHERIGNAKSGSAVSLYSPPFTTSNHGYRMCLRVYLNGDGSGKDEYVSLFLVLMQSDHDDLLSWPFMSKVSLYLINQEYPNDPSKGVKQTFLPNRESASFKKPSSSFNLASGFPKFASSAVLSDTAFVKNNNVYFKCKVDTESIKSGPDYVH